MIGQNSIKLKLQNLTLDNLPHSLMLIGPRGSGKHLITNEISNILNIPLVDISDNLSLEMIDEINSRVEPYIYIISGNISSKEESVILKFLEEPTKNTFIIILCENKGLMLNTIINRCQIWELDAYTRNDLNAFALDHNLELYNFMNTPGKILESEGQPIPDMLDLANKLFDKLPLANFANALTIANKLSYKDEEGFKFELFIEILNYIALIKYRESKINLDKYKLTNKLLNDSYILHIDKKQLFEHYLYEMKEVK